MTKCRSSRHVRDDIISPQMTSLWFILISRVEQDPAGLPVSGLGNTASEVPEAGNGTARLHRR